MIILWQKAKICKIMAHCTEEVGWSDHTEGEAVKIQYSCFSQKFLFRWRAKVASLVFIQN